MIETIYILALSSVKFLLALPASVMAGLGFVETLIATSVGGTLGVLVFFYLSGWLIRLFGYLHRLLLAHIPMAFQTYWKQLFQNPEAVRGRVFNRKNRMIVKTKVKYGLPGIVVLTPVLLSIPLGAFLAKKYYSGHQHVIAYLILSVFFWSFLASSLVMLF